MRRARVNYGIDVAALVSALVVFPTGLILLTLFHVGPHGAERLVGLGLSRIVWMNLHRAAAVAMATLIAVHVQMHWPTLRARLRSAWRRRPGRATRSDLALYLGSLLVSLVAFSAWLILPKPLHHPAIDTHNALGVILLISVVTHVRRHSGWLLRWRKEDRNASQQRNIRDARPPLVERMRQSKYTVDGVKEAVFSGERRPKRLG